MKNSICLLVFALFASCSYQLPYGIGTTGKTASKEMKKAEKKATFEDFLQQFPLKNLPFKAEKQITNSALDWQYWQFIPGYEQISENCSCPVSLIPVARFTNANEVIVLFQINTGLNNYFFQTYTYKDGICIEVKKTEGDLAIN